MNTQIDRMEVTAYEIPTDQAESDGTLEWGSTTMVLVTVSAGDLQGLGYTYSHAATARLIADLFRNIIVGADALNVTRISEDCHLSARNLGRPGLVASAISAVDAALWDLKARLLDLPLVRLLGQGRDEIDIYGSGGFTSYSNEQLREQLGGWAEQGISRVKMKIGRDPDRDLQRVAEARAAIGPEGELFVDANGAYDRKQALALAERFAEQGVGWFEEPVSSDDLAGLRLLRDRAPAGMEIAAGEYGYDLFYFRRMLDAGAVDVLQPDATRCGGVTGFLSVAELCRAQALPLSAHTAPSLHVHLCCAVIPARHLEYFHDHVRIEHLFFEGAPRQAEGKLRPDLSRPGLGLELKDADVQKFAVWRHEGA